MSDKKIGLISGYKPNRISLYILMLTTGRHDELLECLYKDMEKYKENNENNWPKRLINCKDNWAIQ